MDFQQLRWKAGLFFMAVTFLCVHGHSAVETFLEDTTLKIGGQIRPRYELNDKSLNSSNNSNGFTSMRSRLNIGIESGDSVEGSLQIQDVRQWGATAQLATASNTQDVHQAYIVMKSLLGGSMNLKVGRQEISLDGQRLVGAVNWAQQARSFDGISFSWKTPIFMKAFATKVTERSGNGAIETPSTRDYNFYGAWTNFALGKNSVLSVTALYEQDDSSTTAKRRRLTTGLRVIWDKAGYKTRVEAYSQTGDVGINGDVEAYMYGARLGKTFSSPSKPTVTLWYDYLSGDDNLADTDMKAFNTLFATNHKFYGWMDYFINVPAHTSQKGLEDMALKMSAFHCDIKFMAHYHIFSLAEKSSLDGESGLGSELDLAAKWKHAKNITFLAGYSHFFNQNMSRSLSTRGTKDADFGYFQMDFNF